MDASTLYPWVEKGRVMVPLPGPLPKPGGDDLIGGMVLTDG